ncbi:MAG: fumarylacetoacetate hydrolase family protein [Gorillibacterium sp.]|nr:fumarylacetoacetate hydrolase family protein [Gorillibacterium sp.]
MTIALVEVKNVYCVGRNYRLHAEELGNAVPDSPMLFMKPSHAVVKACGESLTLPGTRGEVHYEVEVVLHIGRAYEPGISVDDLVDVMALGIDFTLRSVQDGLKAKGHPWLAAKGFLNSAPIGEFVPFLGIEEMGGTPFSLNINGSQVQLGHMEDMIFSPQAIVDFVAEHYGLGPGDLIFTGTPAGVGPVQDGDHFELFWSGEACGSLTINLDNEGHGTSRGTDGEVGES